MRRKKWRKIHPDEWEHALDTYREKSGEPISEEAIALNEQMLRRITKRRPHDA